MHAANANTDRELSRASIPPDARRFYSVRSIQITATISISSTHSPLRSIRWRWKLANEMANPRALPVVTCLFPSGAIFHTTSIHPVPGWSVPGAPWRVIRSDLGLGTRHRCCQTVPSVNVNLAGEGNPKPGIDAAPLSLFLLGSWALGKLDGWCIDTKSVPRARRSPELLRWNVPIAFRFFVCPYNSWMEIVGSLRFLAYLEVDIRSTQSGPSQCILLPVAAPASRFISRLKMSCS